MLLKLIRVLTLSFFLGLLLITDSTAATTYVPDTLNAKKFKEHNSYVWIFRHWKYKAGDDTSYASRALPDSSWQEIKSTGFDFSDEGLPVQDFKGIAWLRYHFVTDSSLISDTLSLNLEIYGACEVYLDGNLLRSYGTIGRDAASEKDGYNSSPLPLLFRVSTPGEHVFTLRVSNYRGASRHLFSKDYSLRFAFILSRYDFAKESHDLFWDSFAKILLTGIFLAFSALHLVLFFYYRKVLANLFYGLFALSFASFFYLGVLKSAGANLATMQVIDALSSGVFVSFCLLTLIGLLAHIFSKKLSLVFRILVAMVLTYNMLWLFALPLDGEVMAFIIALSVAEILRLIILALSEKKEGAALFAFGLLFFPVCMLIFSFIISYMQSSGNFSYRNEWMSNILLFMLYGSILGISFAMTIYLSRDFSRINKKLYAQILEIKALFDKTIEQENEKKKILEGQKAILETQVKERTVELEQKNRDILDNLHYAKRIQSAILPETRLIYKVLQDAFIFYRPKDIVSGDFYTFSQKEGRIILCAADCTGHGVTGAFMSMIGSSLLNQIVNERGILQPARILDHLNKGIAEALKTHDTDVQDGMDIALCTLDLSEKKIQYAGANRPLWILREGEMMEVKADKFAIGGLQPDTEGLFKNHELQLHKHDILYLFSDGYADQFGGPEGKKMLSKRFREKLLGMKDLPMREQEKQLAIFFDEWKGDYDQVDDVLVIGIRL